MRTRLTIGPIIVLVILGLLWLDAEVFRATRPAISGLILLLALGGWAEFSDMAGMGRKGERSHLGLRVLGALSILYFHGLAWWTSTGGEEVASREAFLLGAGVFGTVFGAFSLVVFRRDFLTHYRGVQETLLSSLLLGFLFSYLIKIYHVGEEGPRLALLFFLGVKGTDIFAYLVGRTLGKHRFLAVSPKKSVEGCVGALVWSCLWFSLAGPALLPDLFVWWEGIVSGIILGVAAQIGDYAESLVKREYQIKDSRALLPEFGGVLDMIDSLIFPGFLFWCWVRLQPAAQAILEG